MAAKKNPLADKANELYKSGMKLVDIADQLGKPEGTIRRWKSTYGWDGERSGCKANKSERSVTKRTEKKIPVDDGTKETLQNDDLTPEQQMFCIYYSRTFNAAQSYQKAYGCKYESAMVRGSELLRNVKARKEIERLKEIKRQQIVTGTEDIVEIQMRIAFGDIGNYLSFGREKVDVMSAFGPVKDPETGENLKKEVNSIKLNESCNVDTQIIQEVKQGKDGASIKLVDKMKALQWLADHMDIATVEQKAKIEQIRAKTEQIRHSETDTGEDAVQSWMDAVKKARESDG